MYRTYFQMDDNCVLQQEHMNAALAQLATIYRVYYISTVHDGITLYGGLAIDSGKAKFCFDYMPYSDFGAFCFLTLYHLSLTGSRCVCYFCLSIYA